MAGYRLSDDERDQALARLRRALEEGRLDFEEHEARSNAALRAVTDQDLVPLFEDLPPESSGAAPVPAPEATPEGSPESEHLKHHRQHRHRAPHPGALLGWGGFLFFVWGVPAIMSGSATAIAVFLGFFLLLVGPGLIAALTRGRGEGGPRKISG
ncbi:MULTISPECIES: DUF1707 domain-containing protein [unclassified Nocardiopsis]|uniref:DUF1707 SHOCT-like domain-containing protein n=1 Tax=unclassified Nocardiopsis TaxID=2649073 RepID=UPI001357947B|nr:MULTISPECIES: DUF1707 domain-containing protein [unclassified Nocardiopsis]